MPIRYHLFIIITFFLLGGLLYAAKAADSARKDAASAASAAPALSADSASKFQSLVIQQLAIQNSDAARQIQQQLGAINSQWVALEAATMTELKLDPKRWAVQVTTDGRASIVERAATTPTATAPPPAAAAPKPSK